METEYAINKLYRALVGEASLNKIVHLCGECMKNPVVIRNSIGEVLAYTTYGLDVEKIYPLWDLLTSTERKKQIEYENILKEFSEKTTPPCMVVANGMGTRFLYDEIQNGKEIWATVIVVEAEKNITQKDYKILREITKIIRHYLHYHTDIRFVEKPNVEHLMYKLLNGEQINVDLEEKYIFSPKINSGFLLMVCRVLYKTKKKSILPEFYNLLYLNYSDAKIVIYEDDIVFLFQRNIEGINVDFQYEDLVHFGKKYHLNFGFSNTFSSLKQVKKAYQQAITALAYGPQYAPNYYYFYNDFACFKLFDLFDKENDITELCASPLLYLLEYDFTYKTEWLKTFCIFILNDYDFIKTSNYLQIHKSTMHYRINKIEEIVGVPIKKLKSNYDLRNSVLIIIYLQQNCKIVNNGLSDVLEAFGNYIAEKYRE